MSPMHRTPFIILTASALAAAGLSPAFADDLPTVTGDFLGDGTTSTLSFTQLDDGCTWAAGNKTGNVDYTDFKAHRDCPDLAAVGDIDGDGTDEVVATWFSLSPWFDASTLVISPDSGISTRHQVMDAPSIVKVEDVNGDGLGDVVVWTDQSQSVSVALGQADATLGDPKHYNSSTSHNTFYVQDVTGDGVADIVTVTLPFADPEGALWVYDVKENKDVAVYSSPDFDPISVDIVDSQGDGSADDFVVVSGDGTTTTFVHLGGHIWTSGANDEPNVLAPTTGAEEEDDAPTNETPEPVATPTPTATQPTATPTETTPEPADDETTSTPEPAETTTPAQATTTRAPAPAETATPVTAPTTSPVTTPARRVKSAKVVSVRPAKTSTIGGFLAKAALVTVRASEGPTGGQVTKFAKLVSNTVRAASPVAAQRDGAQLDGAQLDGAQLDGAQLDGAQLDGAQLDGAQLDGAQLDGAQLDGAQLDGAQLD